MTGDAPLVRFFLGPAGSGKTHALVREALSIVSASKRGRVLILVPDQATAQYERLVLSACEREVVTGITVTGFKRMQHFIGPEIQDSRLRASRSVLRAVLYAILRREPELAPLFAGARNIAGVLDQTLDFVSECKRTGVSIPDILDRIGASGRAWLVSRLGELEHISSELATELGRLGLADDLSLDAAYAQSLKTLVRQDGLHLCVDGFSRFSAIEYAILRELFRIAETSTVALLLDPAHLSGDNKPPAEAAAASILGHPLNTYLDLDRICAEEKAKREYRSFPSPHSRGRFLEAGVLSAVEATLRNPAFTPPLPSNREPDDGSRFRIVEVPNRTSELRFVGREVRKLVAGGVRYRDISVIARSLAPYSTRIPDIFGKYGIPFFLDSPRTLASHPLVRLVADLLSYLVDADTNLFLSIMRNPLLRAGAANIDRLENVLLLRGTDARDINEGLFVRLSAEGYRWADELSGAVLPFCAWCATTKRAKTLREILGLLYAFFHEAKVGETLAEMGSGSDAADAGIHAAAWEAVNEALATIRDILPDEESGIGLIRELYSAAVASVTAKLPPPALDLVTISEVERGRQGDPLHVFVLGLIDGDFPSQAAGNRLLSREERLYIHEKGLTLEGDSKASYLQELYLFYVACTRASKSVTLTLPLRESADTNPSPFLSLLAGLKSIEMPSDDVPIVPERASAITTVPELACYQKKRFPELDSCNLPHALADHVRSILALQPPLQAKRLDTAARRLRLCQAHLSATSLENFAACGFKFFARHNLGLQVRRVFAVDPLEIGKIYHRALNLALSESNRRNISWRDGDESTLLSILKDGFDKALKEQEEEFGNRGYELVAEQLWRDLRGFFSRLRTVLNAGAFTPVCGEVSFGFEDDAEEQIFIGSPAGAKFRLVGRVDRIDAAAGSGQLAVIDYKTGTRKFEYGEFYFGLALQLPIYGHLLEHSSAELAGIAPSAPRRPDVLLFHPINAEVIDCKTREEASAKPKYPKLRGIFQESVAHLLDRKCTGGCYSEYYNLSFKKDGSLGRLSTTDVVSHEDWDAVSRWTERLLSQFAQRIEEGEIEVNPIRLNTYVSCQYCDFSAVCRVRTPSDVSTLKPPWEAGGALKPKVIAQIKAGLGDDS